MVVVVGGGVMGLATAWRLALSGADVVVFERFVVGHDRGSSHGATRVFRVLYDDPVYVRMAQRALPQWRELEATSGHTLLTITGGVQIDDAGVLARFRDAMNSCGATSEDASDDRYPWLGEGLGPMVFVPDVGILAADLVLVALRDASSRLGAEIRERTVVEAIEVASAGVTVTTSSGSVRADMCVVAGGAWANDLLDPLGLRLPLRVTREQVFYFGSSERVLPFVHGVGDHWVYAVPSLDGDLVKVAEHGTGPETTADDRSFDLDPDGAARIERYVRDTLPSLDMPSVGFDTCLYASTPDGDFVMDRRGPVVVVSACSGHGFKFAPLVGDIAARLATGRQPPIDIGRFSIDRF